MKNHRMAIKKVRDFYRVRSLVYREAAMFLSQVQGWQATVLRSAPYAVDLARALLHSGEYPDFPLCSFPVPLPAPDPEKIKRLLEHRLLLSELPPYLQIEYFLPRYQPGCVLLTYPNCYSLRLSLIASNPLHTHIDFGNIRWVVTDFDYQIKGKNKEKSLLNAREKATLVANFNELIETSDPYESIKALDERLRRLAIVGALNELRLQAQELKSSSFAGIITKIDYQKERNIRLEYWSETLDFPEKPAFRFEVKGSILEFTHFPALDDLPLFNQQDVNLAQMINKAIELHRNERLRSIWQAYSAHFGEKMQTEDGVEEGTAEIEQDMVRIWTFGGWNICISIQYESGLPLLSLGTSSPEPWCESLPNLWAQMVNFRLQILSQKLQSVLSMKGLSLLKHPMQFQAGYYAGLCETAGMEVEESVGNGDFERFVVVGNICPATGHMWNFVLRLNIEKNAFWQPFERLISHITFHFLLFENQFEVKSCPIHTETCKNLFSCIWTAVEACERLSLLLCFPILSLSTPDFTSTSQSQISFRLIRPNESYPISIHLETNIVRITVSDFWCSFGLVEGGRSVTVVRSSHDSVATVTLDSARNRLEVVLNLSLIFHRKSRISKLGLERLEQIFDSFRLHRVTIGEPLHTSLQALSKRGIKITTLTHEQASVSFLSTSVTMKTAIERSSKGQKFFYFSISSQPKLVNSNLVECMTFLGHRLSLPEVLEKYSLSSLFQSCLTKALGKYAWDGARVNYNSDSYDSCGFHVVPGDFDQVTLTYMRSYAVRFTVVSECSFEVFEPGHCNPQVGVLEKFVDMLHHCYSRTVSKDKDLAEYKNPVETHNAKRPQLLQLFKPDYVTESLLLILEFMNIQYILKKVRETAIETLKTFYGPNRISVASRAIDLSVNLQDTRLAYLSTGRWTVKLETSRGEMPLLLRLALSLQGGTPHLNKVLTGFFDTNVKRRSMAQPSYLIGWFQVLLFPLPLVEMFAELMQQTDLDIRFDALQVISSEEVIFAVRHKSRVLRVRVLPGEQLCKVLSLQYRIEEFPNLLPSLFLSPRD